MTRYAYAAIAAQNTKRVEGHRNGGIFVVPLTLFIASALSLLLLIVTNRATLAHIAIPLVLSGISALLVHRPSTWVIIAFAGLPLVFYVRQWLPSTVGIGGASFVASGALKELLVLSVLVAALPHTYRQLNLRYLTYPLLMYFVLLLLGAVRAGSAIEGIAYFRIYMLTFVFYLAAPLYSARGWASRIALVVVLLGIIDATLGLYRYFVDENFLIINRSIISESYIAYENGIYRLNGLSQVNTTATLLGLSIFSLLFFKDRSRWLRLLWLPLVLLFLFALALTQSRTGLLILFGSLVFWLVVGQSGFNKLPRITITGAVVITAGVAIILYVTRVMGVDVLSRLLDLRLTSDEGRGYYWQILLGSLRGSEWLFGKGLSAIGSFGLQDTENALASTADNFYLQLLVTVGLTGVLAFIGFSVIVFFRGLAKISDLRLVRLEGDNERHEVAYLLGIMLLLLISNATGVSILEPYIGALFWLSTGVLANVATNIKPNTGLRTRPVRKED